MDFDSVGKFHKKFDLPVSDGVAQEISAELRDFRLRFLLEELAELADGYGLELNWELHAAPMPEAPCPRCGYNGEGFYQPDKHPCIGRQDLPKIADSLIDLVYVALGTGHYHHLPWQALFKEIQRANLSKERAAKDGSDSMRGSSFDVVKPKNWHGPAIIEVLMKAGWKGPKLL